VLPLTLLRERIGLTIGEFGLIQTAVSGQGADGVDLGLLSSIREVDEPIDVDYAFSAEPPASVERPGLGDPLAVLLGAFLRGRPGVGEVRGSWRLARQGSFGGAAAKRILLVTASTGWARLTGELQRVQRAVGEAEPCVEVLPTDLQPPVYHRAALAASELLCAGADETYALLAHS
jgi:hypothetical protein